MAWAVKPSSTTSIPRREKPFLTQAMIERFTAEVLPRYETRQAATLPILIEIQHKYRYIPFQAMMEVALFLEITPADVFDTASFYEEFTTHPTGEHVIAVCQSVACEVCGHQAILDHLREKLDVEPHETTEDGLFTLLTLECLGACDAAPVALVGDVLYENLTIERIDRLLEELRLAGGDKRKE